MAEMVTIKIDIDADTFDIDRVRAKLRSLAMEAEALDNHMAGLSEHADDTDKSFKNLDKEVVQKQKDFKNLNNVLSATSKRFDRTGGSAGRFRRQLTFFDKVLGGIAKFLQGTIKFALKGFLVNLGLGLVSLLAVNAAFKVGAAAIKAWNAALSVGAAAGASFIAVLSGIAAAQRQYNAALQASNYGGGFQGATQANTQLRALQKNAALASLGAEALAGAFAAVSSHTQMNGVLNRALTVMGDFAVASGDPVKGLEAAGNFLGLLVKHGSITEEVLTAAGEVGPAFTDSLTTALKSGKIKNDAQSIMQGLLGGAFEGPAVGSLGVVSETLFGTIRTQFERLKSEFADLGQNFLPEFTTAIQRMGNIVSSALIKISGAVTSWGKGSLVDGLVSGFDKITDWTTNMLINHLPKIQGYWEGLKDTIGRMHDWFNNAADAMRPLLDGARVLTTAFGPVFRHIWDGFASGLHGLSDLLVRNKATIDDFAAGAIRFIDSFGRLFGTLKETFVQLLPVLTTILDVMGSVAESIATVVGGLNKLGAPGSALAAGGLVGIYAMLGGLGKVGKFMRGRAGSAMGIAGGLGSSVGAMTVNAGTVIVNGTVVPGTPGSGIPPIVPPGGKVGVGTRMARAARGPIGTMISLAAAMTGLSIMTGSRTTGGAVAGGTVAGAGIGTMIAPGPGTAIGAGIGAGVGLGYDKIWGDAKRNKKQARKVADVMSDNVVAGLEEALETQDIKRATTALTDFRDRLEFIKQVAADPEGTKTILPNRQTAYISESGITLSEQEIEALSRAPQTFVKSLDELNRRIATDFDPQILSLESNMRSLRAITGKSDEELAALAETLDIDLTQGISSVQFAVENLFGVAIPKAEDMMIAGVDAWLGALDKATLPVIEQQRALEAYDQGANELRERVSTGVDTFADFADFLRTAASFELAQTRDPLTGAVDPAEALQNMYRLYGFEDAAAFQPGEIFEGMGPMMVDALRPMLTNIQTDFIAQHGRELLGRIATDTSEASGGALNLDVSQVSPQAFASMTFETLDKMQEILDSGVIQQAATPDKFSGELTNFMPLWNMITDLQVPGLERMQTPAPEAPPGANAAQWNEGYNLLVTAAGLSGDAAATMAAAGQHLMTLAVSPPIVNVTNNVTVPQTTIVNNATPIPGRTAPPTVTTSTSTTMPGTTTTTPPRPGGSSGGSGGPPTGTNPPRSGDTATSRRLQATLNTHKQMDAMINGKRSIVSSWRNTNLGSLNSDHLTGNAYDLTGQNLGAYAQAITGSGGFAEMHGRGDERHLHVVPSQGGDTTTPYVPSTANNATPSMNVIHVHPSAGMNEEQLARKVAGYIYKEERSLRERTGNR